MSRGMEARQARAAWMFLAPALALIVAFFVIPSFGGFLLGLTDFDLYAIGDPGTARFVGFENFRRALTDPRFWNALRNTGVYVVLGGPLSVLASLAAALLVNARAARAKGLFRVIFFTPVVTSLVAVAIVWRYLYHPRYGLVDQALGVIGLPAVDWLGDPHWAMPAIILMSVWKNFGTNMLVLIAGLQAIPEELYEAASLDGAGGWTRFRHVTLPNLGPTFLFVGVITMVNQFQLFSEPYVMTQGGPLGSTTSLVLMMYEEGFRWWRLGPASALAFLLFVIVLFSTMLQMRLQRRLGR